MSEETKQSPPHVLKAIVAVKKELAKHGGISKDREAPREAGGYNFRGIDDVYNALCGITADVDLVMLPSVNEVKVDYHERPGGKVQTHVQVKMTISMESAKDGSQRYVTTIGEALDTSDKASNKAMSAAMKYACIMAFMVPTYGEGADIEESHEQREVPPPPKKAKAERPSREESEQAVKRMREASPADEARIASDHLAEVVLAANSVKLVLDMQAQINQLPDDLRDNVKQVVGKKASAFISEAESLDALMEVKPLVGWLGTKDLKGAFNERYAEFKS